MEVEFTVISKLILDVNPHKKERPQHKGLKWFLDLSPGLDKKYYFDKDENPTSAGVSVVTKVLCNALIANIHYAHQMKIKDSAEHLREAIKEMEQLFVEIADIMPEYFLINVNKKYLKVFLNTYICTLNILYIMAKKSNKKRAYNIDPLTKLKNGKPWTYHFEIEEDVAIKIIEESEVSGAEYGKIILNRLRKAYGIKKTKKLAA